jgi:hypothetical protein
MKSLQTTILERLRKSDAGSVYTPKDFLDLASRAAVDQTLSRLVRAGQLQRAGRGLYHVPQMNRRLGIAVPPDVDQLATALARKTGSRLLPSGATAANQLGLSTQVPAKAVYLTDGRSRRLRVAAFDIQFKHAAQGHFNVRHRSSALVFQALRYLGKDAVGDRTLRALRSALTSAQRRALRDDARYAPGWVAGIVRGLDNDAPSPQNLTHG